MENSEERKFKVLCATGMPKLDTVLQSDKYPNIEVLGTCRVKAELSDMVSSLEPDIVLVTDRLGGSESIIKLMIAVKKAHPFLRIIYFAGGLDPKDQARKDALGTLVLVGINDIIVEKKMNIDLVIDIIENPMDYNSVATFAKDLMDGKSEAHSAYTGLEYTDYGEYDETVEADNNIYVFTSIKPGTGKSFVSINTACGIARYGKEIDGHAPRVALIEADLQTLSIGTMLGLKEDKYYNLSTALQSVSTIFDRGNIVGDEEKVKHVNTTIRNCFVEYPEQPNLHVLSGSGLTPEEIDGLHIVPEFYTYILNVIKYDYDYIIIDLNSSIFHITTFNLLKEAKTCFYILNLDYNNVRNNIRYAKTIESFGISQKVRYILNQDIENKEEDEMFGVGIEPLIFTASKIEKDFFKFEAKIPNLPLTVQLNRQFEGKPIIFDNQEIRCIDRARIALFDVARTFAEIGPEYDKVVERYNKKPEGFLSKLFGKKK